MKQDMIKLVMESINEVVNEMGLQEKELTAETNILAETALDSIGLAIVVVKMEEKTMKDPFAEGFKTFNTIEELADIYAS